MTNAYDILVREPEGLGVDEKIILEWILGKQDRKLRTGCVWLRKGTNSGLYK
jgi:hypothetical protein